MNVAYNHDKVILSDITLNHITISPPAGHTNSSLPFTPILKVYVLILYVYVLILKVYVSTYTHKPSYPRAMETYSCVHLVQVIMLLVRHLCRSLRIENDNAMIHLTQFIYHEHCVYLVCMCCTVHVPFMFILNERITTRFICSRVRHQVDLCV